ncbi:insulinoma-associated protein 1-like [Amblyraja radiata]|uniref:insulinoma-associated protein 1-like n=1 Tax=Amblyraja radiata TaxID=386614 RepID=UPI00140201D7|nr:insulinoma-associated protein 1-like [Amblyraja radiata]
MPRGFLVKRTNRAAPVSYRVRGDDEGPRFSEGPPTPWGHGMPGSPCAPSRSPDRPAPPGRPANSSSPVSAESFPGPSALMSSLGRAAFAVSVSDGEVEMGSSCAPVRPAKRQGAEAEGRGQRKRPRMERKACRDEVTTSPVLGLRITGELTDCQQPRASGQPLGEFICQLCKEEYVDALSLAQHRCSRIVRVEYRCAECDKVFSCPANLASHCRWHKPKNPGSLQGQEAAKGKTRAESQRDSCNSSPRACDDAGHHEDELFDCPLCGKRFRRQAYLRKHMATHRPPVLFPGSRQLLRQPPAQLGESAAPPPHALRLAFVATEDVPAKPCPEAPFAACLVQSRHLEKSRQVVLLQLSTAHAVM